MRKFLIICCWVINILVTTITFAQNKTTVYIYQDEGVSKESLVQTVSAFKKLLGRDTVKTINAPQLKEGTWTKDAILFVMPGGADLPYAKQLNGKGNKVIKRYVQDGGAFLGICAGSYYGATYVEFAKNGPLEVLGARELGFFKGKAIGPVLAPYDYKTQSGSRAAKIHTILARVPETTVFYNGGGFFKNAEKYRNTKVVGTYVNQLPAIILIRVGKGQVLLSGVHFEYDPWLLQADDNYLKKIIGALRQGNESRKVLFKQLMALIGCVPD